MFQIAGHTMGTPEYTVLEALRLFHDIGLDGAEIVVQDDYRCGIPTDCGEETLAALKETAQKLVELCKGLDRPYTEDAKIREVLIDTLPLYLQGMQSLEETIEKIEGGLKMYLAE